MKAKLIVNNQEIEVEISEEEYKKLQPEKKTGYERCESGAVYFTTTWLGEVGGEFDDYGEFDDKAYEIANYYSDKTVASNNTRADKLMRQLRRFAVEHREKELNWNDDLQDKFYIYYDHSDLFEGLRYHTARISHWMGTTYFDSAQTAQLAIDTFHDELIWYFTEYKDSL